MLKNNNKLQLQKKISSLIEEQISSLVELKVQQSL